jgi:hypothetical protein
MTKAHFNYHYVIGKGGFGKVKNKLNYFIFIINKLIIYF